MIFLLVVFFPSIAFADASQGGYLSYVLKSFGSLLIVVSLMFAVVYVLKKINISSRFRSSRIRVVDRLYIDNKHSIVIAEIDNNRYALGVGENINVIDKLDENGYEKLSD